MRNLFAKLVKQLMSEQTEIMFLTGDLGYPFLNIIREVFPERFINVGAAEQSLFDVAIGLSLSGKYPICYTITPFILRGFETLRTYVDYEKIPMLIVGSGREREYFNDGISHWAINIPEIIKTLPNMKIIEPTKKSLKNDLISSLNSKTPTIITLNK